MQLIINLFIFLIFWKLFTGQLEPLLCKFADGGVKKRNQYNKQQQQVSTQWTRGVEGQISYDGSVYGQRNG